MENEKRPKPLELAYEGELMETPQWDLGDMEDRVRPALLAINRAVMEAHGETLKIGKAAMGDNVLTLVVVTPKTGGLEMSVHVFPDPSELLRSKLVGR